jgi:hypothetical protein
MIALLIDVIKLKLNCNIRAAGGFKGSLLIKEPFAQQKVPVN